MHWHSTGGSGGSYGYTHVILIQHQTYTSSYLHWHSLWYQNEERKQRKNGTQYRSMSVANSVKIPIPAVVIVWWGDGGHGGDVEHLRGASVWSSCQAPAGGGHILQMYSSPSSSSLSSCIHDSKSYIKSSLQSKQLSQSSSTTQIPQKQLYSRKSFIEHLWKMATETQLTNIIRGQNNRIWGRG